MTINTVEMAAFFIDERAIYFIRDNGANLRLLQGVDHHYWEYQSAVHGQQLEDDDIEHRQRAAAALRIAYGQGLETLFAFIGALVQAPTYPLAWLLAYKNPELQSVVRKINAGTRLYSPMRRDATWESVADAVFEYGARRTEDAAAFAELWRQLAGAFLEPEFEPEYNSLKHGMRAAVGGFAVRAGLSEEGASKTMMPIGNAEYGSAFWMPPARVPGYKRTFGLSENVLRGWPVKHFIAALPLIGMSIRNVVSRLLVQCGGLDMLKTSPFVRPVDPALFSAPWQRGTFPSLTHLKFGEQIHELPGWTEQPVDELRSLYEKQRSDESEPEKEIMGNSTNAGTSDERLDT